MPHKSGFLHQSSDSRIEGNLFQVIPFNIQYVVSRVRIDEDIAAVIAANTRRHRPVHRVGKIRLASSTNSLYSIGIRISFRNILVGVGVGLDSGYGASVTGNLVGNSIVNSIPYKPNLIDGGMESTAGCVPTSSNARFPSI